MKSATIISRRADGSAHEHVFEAQNEADRDHYFASWMNHPSNQAILGCVCDWSDSATLNYYR